MIRILANIVKMKEMVKDFFIKLFESYSGVGSTSACESASESASGSQPFASGCGLTSWELDDIDDVPIEYSFSQFSNKVAVT